MPEYYEDLTDFGDYTVLSHLNNENEDNDEFGGSTSSGKTPKRTFQEMLNDDDDEPLPKNKKAKLAQSKVFLPAPRPSRSRTLVPLQSLLLDITPNELNLNYFKIRMTILIWMGWTLVLDPRSPRRTSRANFEMCNSCEWQN